MVKAPQGISTFEYIIFLPFIFPPWYLLLAHNFLSSFGRLFVLPCLTLLVSFKLYRCDESFTSNLYFLLTLCGYKILKSQFSFIIQFFRILSVIIIFTSFLILSLSPLVLLLPPSPSHYHNIWFSYCIQKFFI